MKGNIFGKFKPKNHHFDHVYMKSSQKFTKLVVLVAKKLSKFEENSKIKMYSLVPQIDHPVALCTTPPLLIFNWKMLPTETN